MGSASDFRLLVTGPSWSDVATLLRSVADGRPLATLHDGTEAGGAGSAACEVVSVVTPADRPDRHGAPEPRLVLIATADSRPSSVWVDAERHDADAAVFVVDACAPSTYDAATQMLEQPAAHPALPFVVAVDHCDAPSTARAVSASIGAPTAARTMPCRLVDPLSCRAVVVEALEGLLASLASSDQDRLLT